MYKYLAIQSTVIGLGTIRHCSVNQSPGCRHVHQIVCGVRHPWVLKSSDIL